MGDIEKDVKTMEQTDDNEAGTVVVKDVEAAANEARVLPKYLNMFARALMLICAIYHIYAAGFGGAPGIQNVGIHLGLGMAIIFLCYPMSNKVKNSKVWLVIDVCIAIFSLVNMVYVIRSYETLAQRVGMPITTVELVMGIITFIMLILASKRMMGWAFTIIAALFIAFMFAGPHLPSMWQHSGTTLERFVQLFYLQTQGIYGSITRTSANIIVIFVLFSSVVKYSQIGDFIMDLALGAVGGVRGGPAKVAVVSSGLMGMLSGNSVANVAGTGAITIPLMKRTGYKASFAGGVEAVASTGGQIMPPVMGTSVFLMIEMASTTYPTIMAIAFPIALLYYFGLIISVDMTAVRDGLVGMPKADRPNIKKVVKDGWYLATPVVVLTVLMTIGTTPQKAGFWALIAAIAVSFICPRDRMTFKRLIFALQEGVKDCCVMFAVCGLASLIQGIVQVSGIGVKLSSILVTICGGNLFILLLLTAVVCIILGMGLPVVVCYSFLALLVAPAMVELGVPLLSAHMFVFYFGCLSCITPPVATASLVASGIAKAPFMETGIQACKLAFCIFFMPFVFIYSPEILLTNGIGIDTIVAYVTLIIGVYGASAGFVGAGWPKINFANNMVIRLLLVVLGIVVLVPIPLTNIIGAAGIALCQIYLMMKDKKKQPAQSAA